MVSYREFIEKYGDIEVEFKRYWRYVFVFGNHDESVRVGLGGSASDIYDVMVFNEPIKIFKLKPDWAYIGNKFFGWSGWKQSKIEETL